MRRCVVRGWRVVAITAVLAATSGVQAVDAGGSVGTSGAVAVATVTFTVSNVDTSGVPCASDGATYTAAGRLIAPVSPTGTLPSSVTLYLHGLGFGEFFWDFSAVPAYDYAQAIAVAGHASVVIDRVGYGASGHPVGTLSCIGSQASIAHQIVQALRHGSYALGGGSGVSFQRVALAGHSAGGAIAEVEASSFHDVDALVVMAWADRGSTSRANDDLAGAATICAEGGEQSAGEPGYAPFGRTDADFQAAMFFNADPTVVADVTAMRNLDPCGDDASLPEAIAHNLGTLGTVTVPVMVVYGADDALFQPPGTTEQASLFTGSSDVSSVVLADTGHALTFERTAPQLRQTMSAWLSGHGL